jgi:hypothetical protein
MLQFRRWLPPRVARLSAALLCSGVACVAALVPRAGAQDLTILRYEPLANFESVEPSANGSDEGPAISFTAFGTRFATTLARNDVLTRNLPADVLRRLESTQLYLGTLEGVEHSWVRLTRIDGTLSGAIFDGAELYAIEPFGRIAARIVAGPEVEATEPVIYRWADTLSAATDAVVFPPRAPLDAGTSQKTSTLQSLAVELAALPPGVAPAEMLDIGLLADAEFVQMNGTGSEALMLGVANTVDGIFSAQVGVRIRVAELKTYGSEPDAFDGTDASALLSQLGTVKRETPALRDKGLVHLLTGRNLDEQPGAPQGSRLLGIATFGALCHARLSVGLTQYTDSAASALLAAHEIGHNFGAPHDRETGSPCEAAGDGYLMAPFYNGTGQFSACSLEQMAPEIAAASCLVPNPDEPAPPSSPPPPVATPAPAAPNDGGGGGAVDAWLLVALLGLAAYRRRRNRTAASNV